jgi:hypothetical protein
MRLRKTAADEQAEFENSVVDEDDDEDGGFVMFLVDVTDSSAQTARGSECHGAAVGTYGCECIYGRFS